MTHCLAEVILPVPLPVYYTYIVPDHLRDKAKAGARTIVPLGKSRLYTGIIRRVHSSTEAGKSLKHVLALPDNEPLVSEQNLKLWEWIAFYYHCQVGEVYKAAVPSHFRNFDDVFIRFRDDSPLPNADLLTPGINANEAINLKHLLQTQGNKKTAKALIEHPGIIQDITYKSHLQPSETVLHRNMSPMALEKIRQNLKGSPAQKKLLDYFIQHPELREARAADDPGVSSATLKKGRDAGWIKRSQQDLPAENQRFDFSGLPELNEHQKNALKEIKAGFREDKVCLLHGVTSSGKTLIYLHLIKETVERGEQVLYLLPEIALTTQIIERLRESTGSDVEVFHSKFSGKGKLRLWENIRSGHAKMVVGARSAVFLPFKNPGLIIVDEEHDSSFKQFEPAPRYNARDVAVIIAHMLKTPLLMGSATPSGESFHNARKGKYHMVELSQRYRDMPMPQIKILDIYHARKRKVMEGDFHPETLSNIGRVLRENGQVIVLRNRKGYAPVLTCTQCGWTADCPNCSVHLTYHKQSANLKCHHCHYTEQTPKMCPDCGNTDLKYFGYGTQKVEEDLQAAFPDARIARFDQDSMKSANAYRKIIGDFEQHNTDILVGTQILTKGLDFLNVRLIAVLHADQMLNYPDFRAFERGYQMLEQVSGRTGRHHIDATVLIQTSFPDHPILTKLLQHQYKEMMNDELLERRNLHYPPFVHLIHIHMKSPVEYKLEKRSRLLFKELQYQLGEIVSEPAVPVVEKEAGNYRRFIQVRIPRDKNLKQRKAALHKIVFGFANSSAGKDIRFVVDSDPV
ncbi:MAG: primosomal protein N' [Bacteroidales bacterium]